MRTPVTPIRPADGQESVWDYPRPPLIEQIDARVRIRLGGTVIVDTRDVVRVLETSHPPVYYLPIADFSPGSVIPAAGSSFCEFKGSARYFSLTSGDATAERAAWTYPTPEPGYELLRDRVAVYAGQVDDASVDGEIVVPQPGGFYGGWITSTVVGPFKGEPGTLGW
ncbi:DUF427 domain-containing protein [Leifsonia sp. Leaf264]|uniref:DUF427 domain-containing protein n=1 Tax=Leifsonia sp. Leaf264 TaxID=1736314 RepID=UPI0006F8D2BC|nr:DUF427 domain-containing protein [Leifsonia sp. Leaf264]KQP01725.1 hypothetical protein ASF30_03875 [Leifsonia sp. Leaf264]